MTMSLISKEKKKPINLTENLYQREKWIAKLVQTAKEELPTENYDLFEEYNNEMVRLSHSKITRHKNLTHYVKLSLIFNQDWKNVTEKDIKKIVGVIMEKHSDNGQESNYTFDLKKSLRAVVRFALTGTRIIPEAGELEILRCVKGKTPKDKLCREDLPTESEVQKLLDACADSSRDKAMIAVQNEAGTRIGELLTLQIKHVRLDEYGANLLVDGKTGARKIRIVLSVPYLTKWINVHPMKDDPEAPLFVFISKVNSFGKPMTYAGFNNILRKRVKQSGLTKRIHSHLFRHKEITEMASKLTEAESRMRHGWGRSSPMPARYTHLNQEDLDNKILQMKGVKKEEDKEELELRECVYCKVKHAIDAKYCEICSRPLDVVESMRMEKEQEARTKSLILETLRQEHSNKSKGLANKKLEEENQELRKLLSKTLNDIQ
jgi:integrase/recombinase XerD